MTVRVSVVMAAYNAEPFIERAVRSAMEQTYPVFEIIIVDDGSSDDTASVIRALADGDPRIKLLATEENSGVSVARNKGFAAATGDWIAILDADDAYLPNRIADMIAISEGADLIADNFLFYDALKDEIGPAAGARIDGWEIIDLLTFVDARRDHQDFGLFKPIFRRSFLQERGLKYLEHSHHGEDFLLAAEVLARGGVYRLQWKPGYLYTARACGLSRTPIDYPALARNLEELARREDLDLSPSVRAKLADRVAYTHDLDVRRRLLTAYRKGDIFKMLSLALTHSSVRKTLAAAAARRLRRLFAS